MTDVFKFFKLKLILFLALFFNLNSYADNHNIYETLELIQKDLKTLERAIYSGSIEVNASTSSSGITLDSNSEEIGRASCRERV